MQLKQNNRKKERVSGALKASILGGILLLTLFMTFSVRNSAFAADATIEKVADDCQLITSSGSVTGEKDAEGKPIVKENPHTVPDSFSVGRCLSTKGQQGSKFLPLNEKSKTSAGGITDNTNAPVADGTEKSARIVLVDAIDTLVKIIATVALIVFIIGALITIVSGGKDDLIDRGKKTMTYSVIGLAVALFSFIIVTFLQSLFFVS